MRRIWLTLSGVVAAATLTLGVSGAAWAGQGATLTIGTPSSGTVSAPPSNNVQHSGSTGRGGEGSAYDTSISQSPPPPPPPDYVESGVTKCGLFGSEGCARFQPNPKCFGLSGFSANRNCSDNLTGQELAQCVGNSLGGWTCPVNNSTTGGGTAGYQVGYGPNSGEVQVAKWVVNYAGQTYTFRPTATLDTGYSIRDDCTGAPTTGTVSYYVTAPSPPSIYNPPAGWSWDRQPPPPPSQGPYTSSFTVPVCSPSDQEPAQVALTDGPGPSLENDDAVDANGVYFPFTFVPVVKGGVDQELYWDGGSVTVGPYSPMVNNQMGPAYPRYQV